MPILLVAPLFICMVLAFAVPIGLMLVRIFEDRALSDALPLTAAALSEWDGKGVPDDGVAKVLVAELARARATTELGVAANRLNTEISGFRSIVLKTARQAPAADTPNLVPALGAIDPGWLEPRYWIAMRQAVGPYTMRSLLAAIDLRIAEDGRVVSMPPDQVIFRTVILRTFWISLVVTACCLAFGYPIAYLLANVPSNVANWLLLLVLIPFWTSLLVRTIAWIVLLQEHGVVNDVLRDLDLVGTPLKLIYNRLGVYIALTHVLLPLMILPLYSVMKGIHPSATRAARSLGASPVVALLRVYVPQTRPGIGAGCLLVFVSALGYYVTPSLIGGPGDQMLGYFISFYTNETANWSLAGALSIVLLTAIGILYAVYVRLEGKGMPRWY